MAWATQKTVQDTGTRAGRGYSAGLAEAEQARVLRIVARHGAFFRTRAFAADPDAGETDFSAGQIHWFEAQKSRETGLWTVYRLRSEAAAFYANEDGDTEKDAFSRRAVLSGACFFDALYACAAFETAEASSGRPAAGKDKKELGAAHYRAFAEQEGIVFDRRDNMPIPVSDGEIMSGNCVLGSADFETAEKSRGNTAFPADAPRIAAADVVGALPGRSALAPLPGAPVEAAVRGLERRANAGREIERLEKAFTKKGKQLKQLEDGLGGLHGGGGLVVAGDTMSPESLSSLRGICALMPVSIACFSALSLFSPPAGGIAALLFSTGLASGTVGSFLNLILLMSGPRDFLDSYRAVLTPQDSLFNGALKKVRAMEKTVADGEMKEACRHLCAQAELARDVLALRKAFLKATAGGGIIARTFQDRRRKRALARFLETAERNGVDEGQQSMILTALQANPGSSDFEREVHRQLKKKIEQFSEALRRVKDREVNQLRGLPAPFRIK